MTLKDVYSLLLSSGYPVAYRDYTGEVKKEIPKPPFMVYSVLSGDFDGGDMRKFIREQEINVELYTEGFMLIRYTFMIRDFVPRKEGNLNG